MTVPSGVLLTRDHANGLLGRLLGPGAAFRDGQWEAIDALANGRRQALIVQRTGWGKSVVYFLTTRHLRDQGAGPTLVVSPLLALMRNQVASAERLGLRAVTINSSNRDEWDGVYGGIVSGDVDLVLVSPERFANEVFLEKFIVPVGQRVGLLVIDEAHCISDWGHDFRPDYQRIRRILQALPPGVPVAATTATRARSGVRREARHGSRSSVPGGDPQGQGDRAAEGDAELGDAGPQPRRRVPGGCGSDAPRPVPSRGRPRRLEVDDDRRRRAAPASGMPLRVPLRVGRFVEGLGMNEDAAFTSALTPDATATVLLCVAVEGRKSAGGPRALTVREYNGLARWLKGEGMTPGALLSPEGIRRVPDFVPEGPSRERIEALLARGLSLSVLLEKWSARGIRAVTRSDPAYPARLTQRLMGQRPPVLFVAGDLALVGRRSVAVVGSRDADERALDLTASIGHWAARRGAAVVSGGARGIDSAAVLSALEAGGTAVAVLADGLSRAVLDATYREALGESRLLLATPYSPDAGFNVGNAMGRNKLVYALSDAAVVVSSAEGSGGTWAGATEALEKKWVTVFVDDRSDAPAGNEALLARGAHRFSFDELDRIVGPYELPPPPLPPGEGKGTTVIAEPIPPTPEPEPIGPVFDLVWPLLSEALRQAGAATAIARALTVRPDQALDWLKLAETRGLVTKSGRRWVCEVSGRGPNGPESSTTPSAVRTALEAIRPQLERARALALTPKKLAEALGVRPGQLQDWLSELDGGASQQAKKPRRKPADQPGLFD